MKIMLIIFCISLIYFVVKYNSIKSMQNKVKQAESGIDVYLTQRFNLIPNLVECVKGYMTYEKETLNEITIQRTIYLKSKNLKSGESLNLKCNQIIANVENYPQLKANAQFLNLQKNLSSQLQAARRIYNSEVNRYNTTIEKFPTNIVASICSFKKKEYFEAGEQAKSSTKVKL